MAEEFINEEKIIANGRNGEDAPANTHGCSGEEPVEGLCILLLIWLKKRRNFGSKWKWRCNL